MNILMLINGFILLGVGLIGTVLLAISKQMAEIQERMNKFFVFSNKKDNNLVDITKLIKKSSVNVKAKTRASNKK